MDRVFDILKNTDALLEGHFLLSSGKHSNRYCQCAKITMYPDKAEEVCNIIKGKLDRDNIKADIVVGPAMGGIVIAYELARTLGCKAMFTERENDEMTLRRGFSISNGERVIVCEDVVTTGKSTNETIKVLKEFGANVVAIASIVDRRSDEIVLDYPLYSATKIKIETYESHDCPLCDNNITLVKPGSRKKF